MRIASDWPVWITLGIALLAGFALQQYMENQTKRIDWNQSQIQIPSDWILTEQEPDRLTAVDSGQRGPFGPRIFLQRAESSELLPHGGELWQAAVNWSSQQSKHYTGYRVLRMSPAKVDGRDGIKLEAAYLQEIGPNAKPGLMISTAVIVPLKNQYYVWNFAVEENSVVQLEDQQQRLLETWHLREDLEE
jgi:hypothetical protein